MEIWNQNQNRNFQKIGIWGEMTLFFPLPGKLCIEVTPQSKIAWISETLCIGCGICIKVSDILFFG